MTAGIDDTPLSYKALEEVRAHLIHKGQEDKTEPILTAMIRKSVAIDGPRSTRSLMMMFILVKFYMDQSR